MQALPRENIAPHLLRGQVDRSRLAPVYTGLITASGVALVLLALDWPPADWPGLALFALIAALAELFSVELFTSSRYSSVSVSGIVAIASIAAFGPLAGVLIHVCTGTVSGLRATISRQRPEGGRASWLRRSAFNAGMWVTASALAGWVYVQAGGAAGNPAQPSNVLPLVGASVADVLANLAILIGVIALQTGKHPAQIWKQNFQWAAPIAILGSVLGGGALALAYHTLGALGVAVFFLPVLSTSYAFRLYVRNSKGYVNQLEEMNRVLDEANLDLLETLGAVIDADDMYTYGHSAQVAVYAGALAKKLGLSREQQAVVVKAALVHDIGKIGIMDSLIGKQGPLTDEEYSILKRHPSLGAEIVARMKGLKEIVPLVRHHHERWDGTGYPDGLAGTAIPLGARILALADSLDTMCSDRPYRPTRSFQEVMAEVPRCAGRQFDPAVVNAFFAVVKEQGRDFFQNSAAAVDRHVLPGAMGGVDTTTRHLKKSVLAGPGG